MAPARDVNEGIRLAHQRSGLHAVGTGGPEVGASRTATDEESRSGRSWPLVYSSVGGVVVSKVVLKADRHARRLACDNVRHARVC